MKRLVRFLTMKTYGDLLMDFVLFVSGEGTANCDFRKIMLSRFEDFSTEASSANPEKFEDVKYALVAFIDEVLMTLDWKGREAWMKEPLQAYFFNERTAGEQFFYRLSERMENAKNNIDVLEVYDQCLNLGFEGSYRLLDEGRKAFLMRSLKEKIDLAKSQMDKEFIVPNGLDHKKETQYRWIYTGIFALFFLVHFVLFTVLWVKREHVITMIQAVESDMAYGIDKHEAT